MPVFVAVWVSLARADAPIPPAPDRWVTDTVGFLSEPVRTRLDGELETYERQTGHQVVVWIGSSIGDADLADWAVRTFHSWDVGQKGLDDGLVMFVLSEDRAIDIEVGYGLEGQVPDVTANRIIQDVMAPKLRSDDRDGAIEAGVDAVVAAIGGHPDLAPGPAEPEPVALSTPQLILFGIGALVFLVVLVTNPQLALWFLWSMASRGGGMGGGGGGGFQGGGGRSGGGGARGTW